VPPTGPDFIIITGRLTATRGLGRANAVAAAKLDAQASRQV